MHAYYIEKKLCMHHKLKMGVWTYFKELIGKIGVLHSYSE